MGWQDRDWARWTDAERRRFYGPAPARGSGGGGRDMPTAGVLASVALVLVLAVVHPFGFGFSLPAMDIGGSPSPAPSVRARKPLPPLTPEYWLCTERRLDQRTGRWRCTEVSQRLRPHPAGREDLPQS
jgi:hypothetical protein